MTFTEASQKLLHNMTKILLAANTDWYLYNFRNSLTQYLQAQGFEVILVSPAGKFAPRFQDLGFRWVMWQVGRQSLSPWSEIAAIKRLARIYRNEKPDLVHHHTIKPVLYGSLAAQRLGIDCVVNSITGRGYVFLGNDPKARFLQPIVKYLYRLAFRHVNSAAIFENNADRQYFITENIVAAECTWLVPGVGVDPQHFLPTPEPDGIPVVLLSGRMLWDKGVGVLVEAARLLHQKTQVRFVLAGEPDPGNPASINRDILRGWEQEGIVEWWGWQPDMNAVYGKSHIVALPTFGEGVPVALLEAAACGRPIVTSDVPGCRDVVLEGHNGLTVPPGDPVALADALGRLISAPDLRGRMGTAGRQLILQKFTTSQVNASTLAVYRKLLGKPENLETKA